VKKAGVDEKDIATQAISVGPTYNYVMAARPSPATGPRSRCRDPARSGDGRAILDSVVAAGGNAARVDSLAPFVTDPTVAAGKARAQAVEIATAQAQQYAKLLGFTLGPVANVTESSTTAVPPPIAYADVAAAPAEKVTTPVEAGTQQVSVSVSIAWSIAE
jgi:hypothetical protein